MRNIKELLKLLLNYIEKNGMDNSGLCWGTQLMFDNDMICSDEVHLLFQYIETNMPHNVPHSGFAWPKGLLKPRIKWLKKEIKNNIP